MSSLREIKGRIATVGNTLKITSAMSMISSVKLHKSQNVYIKAKKYENTLSQILKATYEQEIPDFKFGEKNQSAKTTNQSSITKSQDLLKNITLVVISSNTTLCGAFNSNIEKLATDTIKEYQDKGTGYIQILTIGKTVAKHLSKRFPGVESLPDKMADRPDTREIEELASRLSEMHKNGEADVVEFIYNHFASASVQKPVRERFLPLILFDYQVKDSERYIYEPGLQEIRTDLIKKCLVAKTNLILADSRAAEHSARTVAMQMATDNAQKILQELSLQYNKMRQQAITNELLDIMGGYSSR